MAAHTTTAAPPNEQHATTKSNRAPLRPLNHDPYAVRTAREARGLTQKELAEKTGRKHTHISEIETGNRDARPELLKQIADVLDVSVELLERPRTKGQCPECDYRYDFRPDGRIPLHLGDGDNWCPGCQPDIAKAA